MEISLFSRSLHTFRRRWWPAKNEARRIFFEAPHGFIKSLNGPTGIGQSVVDGIEIQTGEARLELLDRFPEFGHERVGAGRELIEVHALDRSLSRGEERFDLHVGIAEFDQQTVGIGAEAFQIDLFGLLENLLQTAEAALQGLL